MKLICIVVIIMLTFAAVCSADDWSIREIPVRHVVIVDGERSETTVIEYCLQHGTEQGYAIDEYLALQEITITVMAIHPVPGVKMPFETQHRWYVNLVDNRFGINKLYPLFQGGELNGVPIFAHVLHTYGIDNEDLILIAYNPYSETTRVYFHPDHDGDKEFYRARLKEIKQYWFQLTARGA